MVSVAAADDATAAAAAVAAAAGLPTPVVALPPGLVNSNTGVFLCDVAALVTMVACLPTLGLYWRKRRYGDLATFGLGFILACVYHICQMDADGLAAASVAGIPGPVWRTWDILCAQWLLGRAFGHFVGAKHPVTVVLTNAAFPAAVLSAARSAAARSAALNLLTCAKALLGVLAAAGAAKLGLEGAHTLPPVGAARLRKVGACIVAGVAVFPLPEIWPSAYWACHSAWHCLMAAGLHEMYLALEGEPPAAVGKAVLGWGRWAAALPRRAGAALAGVRLPPSPTAAAAAASAAFPSKAAATAFAGVEDAAKAAGGRAAGAVRHLHAWAAGGAAAARGRLLSTGGGGGAGTGVSTGGGGLLPAGSGGDGGWARGLAASSLRAVAAAAGLASGEGGGGGDAAGVPWTIRAGGGAPAPARRRRSARQLAAAAARA